MASSSPLIEEHSEDSGHRIPPDLGPSDSSDSASDLAGEETSADSDPNMPVDAAMAPDGRRPGASVESLPLGGRDSDSAGTGERRSAAGDAGERDANDIAPDHIVAPDGPAQDDDESDDGSDDDEPGTPNPNVP